jgi:hypothetical protein
VLDVLHVHAFKLEDETSVVLHVRIACAALRFCMIGFAVRNFGKILKRKKCSKADNLKGSEA